MNMKPSFFIVGAPKAGTTALHAFLDKHPEVCMSSDKEPNYFSHEEIEKQNLYYKKANATSEEQYLKLFQADFKNKISGEASVSYLFYPQVASKIKNYQPDAKIIISLRQPVKRAFSHYQMDYSLGLVKFDFETIFRNGIDHPQTKNYYQQYFLLSDYFPQVARYQSNFPSQQILIILHEELINDTQKSIKRLCEFLEIHYENEYSSIEQQNVTTGAKNKFIRSLYQNQYLRKVLSLAASDRIKNKLKEKFFAKGQLPGLDSNFEKELNQFYKNGIELLKKNTTLNIDSWIHE